MNHNINAAPAEEKQFTPPDAVGANLRLGHDTQLQPRP